MNETESGRAGASEPHPSIDRLNKLNSELSKDNRELKTKLTILYAFIDLLRRGYDALLHFGVNYQSLPEYKRDAPLDRLEGKPLDQARNEAVSWIGGVISGIDAAVRRKQFKVHENKRPDPNNTTRH